MAEQATAAQPALGADNSPPVPSASPAGAYGAPSYGADSYGADSYGAAPYGADSYSAPRTGASQYGAPPAGADSYSAPPTGGSQYGAPPTGGSYGGPPAGAGPYGAPPAGPVPSAPLPQAEAVLPHTTRGRHRAQPREQGGEPVYHTSAVYGSGGEQPPSRKNRRTLLITVGAGALALIVVAVLLVVVVFKPGTSTPKFGLIPAGSSPQQDGQQVAAAFLTAWKTNDLAKAANYTDNPAAAQAALTTYATDLKLGKLAASPTASSDAKGSTAAAPRQDVTFAVRASVAAGSGKSAERTSWSYHSVLTAYQKPGASVWFVSWQPDVVAPNLTASTHLATLSVPPTVSEVTDASGASLLGYKDPGLDTIGGILKASPPASAGAKAGLDVQIVTTAGKPVPNSQAILVAPGNYPTVSTTINPKDEAAARAAVALHKQSSMIAIQPSTGHILAIANNAGFNDFALTANVAPGSTMKVITSAALLNAGVLTPDSAVACPPSYTVTGITYHNDQGESEPAGTPFSTDFAQSCNNAFTTQWPHLSGKLASTAKTYFGLNQKWNIGIAGQSASYFNAPASASGSELAQEAFGEGSLSASPIAMASVAATVATGTFKQPVLTLTAPQVKAAPLPASTDAGLKQMMREVVTTGTGAGLGLGATVYAKTGTADISGQDQPNSWMIAFDPTKDIAVGCLVVNAGYGAQFAGPEMAAFLNGL